MDEMPPVGPPVAGLVASAGGLDAFKKFFTAMPPDSGIAFVLVPHLDPQHESLMVELLSRHTAMPVVEVAEAMLVEANHVYVIPPNKYMTISGGVFCLTGPVKRGDWQTSIDSFLRSLADDQQERAICVVLSGTGAHGTLGLKAVKAAGGMAIVQDPRTAEYPRMPQSAIGTGLADHVLAPEQMPKALVSYVQHFYVNGRRVATEAMVAPDHMNQLLALLRARANFDFRYYRPKMLARRVERRMGLNHIDHLGDYLAHLRENPDEVKRLARDLLLSVTSYFRDAEAFRALETGVIAPLVAAKDSQDSIRVWVPGCATGEEPYSIAMLVLEHLSTAQKSCRLQIFATDVDQEALEVARQGIYPESISADVSAERLARFFIKTEDSSYQVNKQLRESVVFAPQNLITDAPFSKMDLVSCRNVLIYLEAEVQKKIINLLHFALNMGGFLFLGPSESIGRQVDLFEAVSKNWRIYRRIGATRLERVEIPIAPGPGLPAHAVGTTEGAVQKPPSLAELTHRLLIEQFAPTAVLVNRKYEILYFVGNTGRYLEFPTGEPAFDLTVMAREGLRTKLRGAVHKAVRDGQPVELTGVRVKRNGGYDDVAVRVMPVQSPKSAEGLMLVTFQDVAKPALRSAVVEPPSEDAVMRQLEAELHATKEDLQCTIEEMESSNEEIKASNEEVMSMNEELQSTNEELETSKEELQSLNEELNTVNNQLQDKVAELEGANNDLANLLNCTDVATVFLDTQFRIRRFTPSATVLFNLIATDLGRPIADVTRKFADSDFLTDGRQVLQELVPREREVRSEGDRWWTRRILPYRTLDDRVEGVAITLVDITERRKAADIMVRRHAAVVENSADAIFSKDLNGTIRSWNRGAIKLYGYSIEEAVGRSVKTLVPTDRIEEWAQAMSQLARGESIEQLETEQIGKDGKRVAVSLTISPIRDANGKVVSASVTGRDITERKRFEAELRRTAVERKRLEGQIVEIALLEQQRLGAELHDGCGQDLTALGILAGSLIESLKAHSPSDVEVAGKIGDGLKHVLQCIRDKAQGLSKASIQPAELAGALEELTTQLAEKSGILWTYDDHEAVSIHDDLTATQLYHIAQEACTNALKHANAQNVRVCLHLDGAHVILRIEDDGIGIPAESSDGLGLRIMHNRAAVIGGKLTIESRHPAGTIVTCTIPVEHKHAAQ